MGRTGRSETAASMIQNRELSGKVGRDPGPAHRSGHRDCLPERGSRRQFAVFRQMQVVSP